MTPTNDIMPTQTPPTAPQAAAVSPQPAQPHPAKDRRIKSSTTTGILGVAAGTFGAADWYMGRILPALIHTTMGALGIVLIIVASIIDGQTFGLFSNVTNSAPGLILYILAYLLLFGSAIWGAFEGFIILAKGDSQLEKLHVPTTASVQKGTVTEPLQLAPATKKRLITIFAASGGAVALGLVTWAVLSQVLRIDYGEAYRVNKELSSHIYEIYTGYDCTRTVTNVDSSYTTEKAYNSYAEACKNLLGDDGGLVAKLGTTVAIQRDSKLAAQYKKFTDAYYRVVPENADIAGTLDLYKAWHSFYARADAWSPTDTESQTKNVVKPLTDSGNSKFKKYGEGWLELALAYRRAYAAYNDPNAPDFNAAYDAYTAARQALYDYETDADIDLEEMSDLGLDETTAMYNEFATLQKLLATAYAENYNYGSGDCEERNGGVLCR